MVTAVSSKIKVIIVDDSALMRELIQEILKQDPHIEVVATASDPYIAREKIKIHNPDVMTLDIEMPRMNGLEFLEKVMTLRPMPVVMVSTLTQRGADITLQCLSKGAVDYISKPTSDLEKNLKALSTDLIQKVKAAARAKIRPLKSLELVPTTSLKKFSNKVQLIVIGASTGGVQALEFLLASLPPDLPPILIAQHMPPVFTSSFAQRLNEMCAINVKEAVEGEEIKRGYVYIAPGGFHLRVKRQQMKLVCELEDGPLISGNKPSVDALFHSVGDLIESKSLSGGVLGLILTGMGQDGAVGLKRIRDLGVVTLGQDESSSIVYGMPKAAMEIGAVESQLPLNKIPAKIVDIVSS